MAKGTSLILIGLLILATVIAVYFYARPLWVPAVNKVVGKRTVADVVDTYGDNARARLRPYFSVAGVSYPPQQITLLGLKDSAELELWAQTEAGPRLIRTYPIEALSGVAGPKLREGDKQVPEGIYRIEGLNPNSAFHLSMKLNYPNAFDLKHANAEGRDQPGSNIFIHGKAVSVGCLAMGDSAIEELFVLATDLGRANIEVAIAPIDPRIERLETRQQPEWIGELYGQLNSYFDRFHQHESGN